MDNIFDIKVNLEYDKKVRRYKKKHDKKLLEDIYYLRSIIDDNNLGKISERLYKKGSYLCRKYEYLYLIKDFVLFHNTVIKNKEQHIALVKKKKLLKVLYEDRFKAKEEIKPDDSIEYAINFMKQYNSDFYELFKELYENDHIKFTEPIEDGIGGCTYPINDGLPYVIIYTQNSIYDAGCLIHEIAHCYQMKNHYESKKNYPDFYPEVYSHYTQMLFYEYMKDDQRFKDDIVNIKRHNLESLRCRLARLSDYFKNIRVNATAYNDIQYAYGITLALYYYNMHLNNPENAEYFMNFFVKSSNLFKQEEVLNKYAINKDKLLTKEMIKNYMK